MRIKPSNKRTIRQVKEEISELKDFFHLSRCPRILKIIEEIRKENAPAIASLEKELKVLEGKKKAPKPRIPVDTPERVLKFCESYWSGTTEAWVYRIHCWNDNAVWTSYPSGGFSTNGGWNPAPAMFYLLKIDDKDDSIDLHRSKFLLDEVEGRISHKELLKRLSKYA